MAKNRQELMRLLQEYGFYAVELNLFLDNHPNDRRALRDYNKVSEIYANLKKDYEMQYGPLTNFGNSLCQEDFNWINDPWPWEGKY